MLFAGLLKQLRTAAGLTQEELAEAASLSPRSISDLERGINLNPRRETTRLLADALGLQGSARTIFETAARGRVSSVGVLPDEHQGLPNAASVAAATRTLPRDTAAFTGRDEELALLRRALEDKSGDSTRVVTVHAIDGMAGIGKTAFAVHAAHQLAEWFPDGQIFLRLHAHTPGQRPVEPADALATLLLTAGIPAQDIPADIDARAAFWRNLMSGKNALLVLDDATGTDQVRPLLPDAETTFVLITSRRRLAALPEALPITMEALRPGQATELFARLVDRADVRSSDPDVEHVTRLCGYLPLAINLMAGQLKHHQAWALADLTADLSSEHDRLAAIRAEDHSVGAAFDLSYAEIGPSQQHFFRRLGLQPGADIDAYAAAALAGMDPSTAGRLLEDLYAQHLIEEPVRGRYRFHDLIREHARALVQLDDPTDRSAATGRLLGYYLHMARAADRHLARRTPVSIQVVADNLPVFTPDLATRSQSVTWMETERLNLHAAVDYAVFNGQVDYVIAIPVAMHGFLRINGHWGQAVTLHRAALSVARRTKGTLGKAATLANLDDMEYLIGNYRTAARHLTEAIEVFQNLGNELGVANGYSTLGLVQRLTGDLGGATACLTRALDSYRTVGDMLGEAISLSELGNAQYLAGQHQTATCSLSTALRMLRELGDQNGEGATLLYLSAVQQASGDYTSATASLTRALELYRNTGTPWGTANALLALGDLQLLTGELTSAAISLEQALQIYKALGHRSGEAETLNSMGDVSLAHSQPAGARLHYAQALALARSIAAPLEEARALEGEGRCQIKDGHADEGRALLHQALGIYRTVSSLYAQRLQDTL